jgi:hypothetical protein
MLVKEDGLNPEKCPDTIEPRGGDAPTDGGFTTAELLANAALAIGALVAIWLALKGLGIEVVDWIRQQLQM